MACFGDINVSQGSVLKCSNIGYARCGGIFNIHLTTKLPRNLPVKYCATTDDNAKGLSSRVHTGVTANCAEIVASCYFSLSFN